jgi:hypothetical protein
VLECEHDSLIKDAKCFKCSIPGCSLFWLTFKAETRVILATF